MKVAFALPLAACIVPSFAFRVVKTASHEGESKIAQPEETPFVLGNLGSNLCPWGTWKPTANQCAWATSFFDKPGVSRENQWHAPSHCFLRDNEIWYNAHLLGGGNAACQPICVRPQALARWLANLPTTPPPCIPTECTPTPCTPASPPTPAPTQVSFGVGDKVRVKASVDEPRFGWGLHVKRTSTGVVAGFGSGGAKVYVDFPEQSGWTADSSEMERVNNAAELVAQQMEEHTSMSREAQGNSPSCPPIPCPQTWCDPPTPAPTQESFGVGDTVRVKAAVEEPRFGWGLHVKRTSTGVVAGFGSGGAKVYVDFPEQSGWTADSSEMERVTKAMAREEKQRARDAKREQRRENKAVEQ